MPRSSSKKLVPKFPLLRVCLVLLLFIFEFSEANFLCNRYVC